MWWDTALLLSGFLMLRDACEGFGGQGHEETKGADRLPCSTFVQMGPAGRGHPGSPSPTLASITAGPAAARRWGIRDALMLTLPPKNVVFG